MINMLIILLILSFSGIFLFVVYMNHLDKRIYELEKKIDTLQYQTDDVLHDIDVVNKNIRNYYGLLRRTEDEKIDAEPNLERLWHDVSEEPKDRSNILVRYNYLGCAELRSHRINYNHLPSWSEFIDSNEIEEWAYVSDILPKGGEK